MSVVHDSFRLERTYPVAPDRVFAAWASLERKSKWFGDDAGGEQAAEHTMDFRVGGREHLAASVGGGTAFTYDACYQDIVEDERIVWSYDMTMDGRRISVSVGTLELTGVPGGTRLVLTEQGAYLDGLDNGTNRRTGTEQLLDKLGDHLE
jgi:uncharacterized protein YndB with AHSA1/START domain